MAYLNLTFAVISAFVAGVCFSSDLIAAGVFNVFAMSLNIVAVAMHLEYK